MALPPADPGAAGMSAGGAPAPDDTGDDDQDQGGRPNIICSIADNGDGTFTVYQGDEPDEDEGAGESQQDMELGAPSAADQGGQHADSIGAALKMVMNILQESASSQGAPGSSESQFQAGFGMSKQPTPAAAPAARGGM